MQRLMEESGFRIGPALSLTSETHVKPEVLYDKEGPFQQEWRSGDRYITHLSASSLFQVELVNRQEHHQLN